jgi:tRNA modification GTPase
MDFTDADTIAAISTPPGEAGVGIVRLSGPGALEVAGRIFFSPKGRKPRSHRVVYGFVRDPETGEQVDEVLLNFMRAPHSYTREDVVEINCHGGVFPMRRVLELTLRHGARLAGPGEFTKRAFLNGRLDLAQAEAVLDLIRAKTEASERIALEQLRGALSGRINSLRERVLGVCAHVEAYIDFPEEDIETGSMEEMKKLVREVMDEAASLSGSFDEGRIFREGVKTAIVGRPNVGKSSLLNALLLRDRAIVTEMPGTTRDVIEECLNIKGLPLVVMDTAGIREAHDMAEAEGVRRSLMAIEDADLVIVVLDGNVPLNDEDGGLIGRVKEKNSIIAVNKSDLLPALEDLSGLGLDAVRVSAKTGEGIDELKELVFGSCIKTPAALGDGVMVTNLRHKEALDASARFLGAALEAFDTRPVEIISMELREALDRLGEIVGHVTTEDILDRIFSEFCIGK